MKPKHPIFLVVLEEELGWCWRFYIDVHMCIYIEYKYRCLDKWVSKYDIQCECICIIYDIYLWYVSCALMNVSVPKRAKKTPNQPRDRVDISSFFRLAKHDPSLLDARNDLWIDSTPAMIWYCIYTQETHRLSLSLFLISFSSLDDLTWPNFRGQIMSNPPAVNSGGLVCKELDPSLFGASRVVSLPNKKQRT